MLVAVQELMVARVVKQHFVSFDGIEFTPKMKEDIQSILERAEKEWNWKWTFVFRNNDEATELKDAFLNAVEKGKIEGIEESLENLRTSVSILKNHKIKKYLPIVREIYKLFYKDVDNDFIDNMYQYLDDFINCREMEELPKRLSYYNEKWNIMRQDLLDKHYETLNALLSTTKPTSDQLFEAFMTLRLFKYYARCSLARLLQKYVSYDVNKSVIDLVETIRKRKIGKKMTIYTFHFLILEKRVKLEADIRLKSNGFIAFDQIKLEQLLQSIRSEGAGIYGWGDIPTNAETVLKTSKLAEAFSPVRIDLLKLSKLDHLESRIIGYKNALDTEWKLFKLAGFG